ncbi:MAG: hypothetical protein KGL95_08020, partial [Patescibacteria group bacterium]|nr:hypothetical protein [Patescibacteria group bacterium]
MGAEKTPIKVPRIKEKDRQAVLENVLSWGTEPWKVRNPNARSSFEDYYQRWGELGKKYALAEVLIEDQSQRMGMYKNPKFLLDAFIPPDLELEGETQQQAEEFRYRLQLLLLKHNLLAANDPEAESAVMSFVERDAMLTACMGILPLPIMSALVTVEMYKDMTDEERLQTYMNNNARSLLSSY